MGTRAPLEVEFELPAIAGRYRDRDGVAVDGSRPDRASGPRAVAAITSPRVLRTRVDRPARWCRDSAGCVRPLLSDGADQLSLAHGPLHVATRCLTLLLGGYGRALPIERGVKRTEYPRGDTREPPVDAYRSERSGSPDEAMSPGSEHATTYFDYLPAPVPEKPSHASLSEAVQRCRACELWERSPATRPRSFARRTTSAMTRWMRSSPASRRLQRG
jgi:hypothetical protein